MHEAILVKGSLRKCEIRNNMNKYGLVLYFDKILLLLIFLKGRFLTPEPVKKKFMHNFIYIRECRCS